jgi:hypothetical protein
MKSVFCLVVILNFVVVNVSLFVVQSAFVCFFLFRQSYIFVLCVTIYYISRYIQG